VQIDCEAQTLLRKQKIAPEGDFKAQG